MSEYWKSTPKYWCKHCGVYVKDTKLERTNHEATGKHQGALKRFLRDLHRGHENEQREKERAKREVERLNGIVGTSSGRGPGSGGRTTTHDAASGPGTATQEQRQKQWEQLAEMGVDVPTELRKDMAMPSEWTVTKTRIIDDTPKGEEETLEAKAVGVRKRPRREGEESEEEALKILSKKPKKWGRDTRALPGRDDELDALLSGPLVKQWSVEPDAVGSPTKKEEEAPSIKGEPIDQEGSVPEGVDPGTEPSDVVRVKSESDVPPVIFKKRKSRNARQK